MRILLLNYEFPPLGGGAGNATKYLLREYARDSDLEIDLITSSVDEFRVEAFSASAKFKVHYLDIGKRGNIHYQSQKDLLLYTKKAYGYAMKLKEEKEYDLVHAFFGIPCGFIAEKLGLPYIVSLRGSDVPFYSRRFFVLDLVLFRYLSKYHIWRRARFVIANSKGLRELALHSARSGQAIGVIPNGIDTAKFSPSQVPCEDALRVLGVGRLIERKGYHLLIEALAGLRGVRLILVGGGPMKEELERLATKRRVDATFLGEVAHDELPAVYAQADLFVLPSSNEGMSNTVLEAMASGLPVVTTDTGGSEELVIQDLNGCLLGNRDVASIREAVTLYLENPHLCASQGRESRKIAQQFSWASAARAYKEIYKKCCNPQANCVGNMPVAKPESTSLGDMPCLRHDEI